MGRKILKIWEIQIWEYSMKIWEEIWEYEKYGNYGKYGSGEHPGQLIRLFFLLEFLTLGKLMSSDIQILWTSW